MPSRDPQTCAPCQKTTARSESFKSSNGPRGGEETRQERQNRQESEIACVD